MPLAVGVIGLGAMGGPIAGFLARAGVPTTCHDPDPAARARVRPSGAVTVESTVELAAGCDVVLVMVPSDADVLAVCADVLSVARAGTTVVISSSVTPDTCLRVEESARARDVRVLDAALTGGVRAAEAGEINLLVGGDERVLARVAPVLAPWTSTVHHLGPLGAGQIGKTVHNLCHWGQLAAIVEAMRLGRALGVDPGRLRAAVLDGPAASRTLAEMELMRLTWYRKDLANALRMAASVHRSLPVAVAVRAELEHVSPSDIAELYASRPGH